MGAVEEQMAQQLRWRWNVGVLGPEGGDEEGHSQAPPARHLQEHLLEGEALMLLSAVSVAQIANSQQSLKWSLMSHSALIKDILSPHLRVDGAVFSNQDPHVSAWRSTSKTLIYKMNLSKAASRLDYQLFRLVSQVFSSKMYFQIIHLSMQ